MIKNLCLRQKNWCKSRLNSFQSEYHFVTFNIGNYTIIVIKLNSVSVSILLVAICDLLEDRCIKLMTSLLTFSLYCTKQIDSIFSCICSVIDHTRHQNVLTTSVTHLPNSLCATFLFLPHFDHL